MSSVYYELKNSNPMDQVSRNWLLRVDYKGPQEQEKSPKRAENGKWC